MCSCHQRFDIKQKIFQILGVQTIERVIQLEFIIAARPPLLDWDLQKLSTTDGRNLEVSGITYDSSIDERRMRSFDRTTILGKRKS